MCGIAGVLNGNGEPVSSKIIKNMTDAISHRGPDGEGCWIEANVGLGHRRLSIIDLSPAGHQPMISVEHRFILSYNGEIYNFRELRIELEAKGYWFRSKTDSEVVLNAFSEWGIKCLDRFNGMFAFAIWDRKDKQLTLARDRYGIKPLYYTDQGGNFSFASEQKAILTLPTFKRKVNHPALLE
ncbi:MAG TPA: asparagine synthetase B, partial [Rhodospirillales bacterium]|nr:asparagine synthetase B [Rhodospirillales bacterium]